MDRLALFDTHTHFDVPDFDADREHLAYEAKAAGVEKLVLIGFVESRFNDLVDTHHYINSLKDAPESYLAPGLHPFYIEQHQFSDLDRLENLLKTHESVAVGEIGLDTLLKQHKQPEVFQKQQDYFSAQLELAAQHHKPVLLHIRKAHADVLNLLKKHKFKLGGIAHAFSGGIEEAKAFVNLGFKLGITGQVTNPNAKKLRKVVQDIGPEHLVIETDCPDMTPLCCQTSTEQRTRNVPGNLTYILDELSVIFGISHEELAKTLWHNSFTALHISQKPTKN